mgnify:CR=1 FL=1
MPKLSYEAREKHLEKNPDQQKERKKITKKTGKEIFALLSEKPYRTSFEMRKTDDYYQNTYRFYHDYSFKKALEEIKFQLGLSWSFRYQTIDKIISFTQEIQSLVHALDTSTPQSSPQTLLKKEENSDLYHRDENGVGYFNFFPEEKQKPQLDIAKPEQKEHKNTKEEISITKQDTEENDEGRDERDYSNRLRIH